MKTCTRCRESKSLEEFNAKRAARDGRQNVCRDCNRASARRYYALNREAHIRVIMVRTAAQRKTNLEVVGRHLLENPCADCGEADLRVLDFDHRDATQKVAEVMTLAKNGYSTRRILDEIDKCDVRCRNCHAKVTYERMGANWRSAFIDAQRG